MTSPRWPPTAVIETPRLILEPLRVDHATEIVSVLDDESLHEYTGGWPATLQQLRDRYTRQIAGQSPDGVQGWFNWVARHREGGSVVGTVQATVHTEHDQLCADLAWVVAVPFQGQGYAGEAATAMARWLARNDVGCLVAYIHPDHHASTGVARRLGLTPTDVIVDGETRWTT